MAKFFEHTTTTIPYFKPLSLVPKPVFTLLNGVAVTVDSNIKNPSAENKSREILFGERKNLVTCQEPDPLSANRYFIIFGNLDR